MRLINIKVFVGEYLGKMIYQFVKDFMRTVGTAETASLTQIYTAVSPENTRTISRQLIFIQSHLYQR